MTPKVASSHVVVWARFLIFPKATSNNLHLVDHHRSYLFPHSSQQYRLASTISEQTYHYGFYQKNTQAREDHQKSKNAWHQGIPPHPNARVATVLAGTSAAFWFNHNREMKLRRRLQNELATLASQSGERTNCWFAKNPIFCNYFTHLSVILDGTRQCQPVYMMGVMPDNRISSGREQLPSSPLTSSPSPSPSPPLRTLSGCEPLTPPLTTDNSLSEKTFGINKGKQPQTPPLTLKNSSPLESAMFDFESFINRNIARSENIMGLYYARHVEGLSKNNKPNQTPAHFFQLASEKFHPSAQFNLALCYHYGKGGVTLVDLQKAIEYYTLAAASGHKLAQYNLGLLYRKGGKGVQRDIGLSLCWLQKAAEGENGYLPARLATALTWKNGVEGILPSDTERAKEILRHIIEESDRKIATANASSSSGANANNPVVEMTSISSAALANYYLEIWSNNHSSDTTHHPLPVSARYHYEYLVHPHSPAAAYNLGVLYESHLNDLPQAVKCYKLAVHLGEINNALEKDGSLSAVASTTNRKDSQCVQNAMWNLGIIYAKGAGGTPKDLKAAKKWFDAVEVKDQEMKKVVKWLEKKINESEEK